MSRDELEDALRRAIAHARIRDDLDDDDEREWETVDCEGGLGAELLVPVEDGDER